MNFKIGSLDLSAAMKESRNMEDRPMGEKPLAFAPKARNLSDEAARAAQNVIDMQIEIETLKSVSEAQRSHIRVLEDTNAILQTELEVLKKNNASLERENTVIHTRIETAAEILLKLRAPLSSVELGEASIQQRGRQEVEKEGEMEKR